MIHRALPLDIVEARQRAARVAWTAGHVAETGMPYPMVCNACNTGTPGDCDCQPYVADRLPEDYDEDQSVSADWEVLQTLGKWLAWAFFACFCAWLIAGGPNSDALEMLLAFLERRNA